MRILLVAATVFEIRPLFDKLNLKERQTGNLGQYQYLNHHIDLLIPGIGMVPTAYFVGRQLALQQYDLAINAGIAGTFQGTIPLGSVVHVVEDCVPELGAEDSDNFISVFELGLADPDIYPYQGGKLKNDSLNTKVLCRNEILENLTKVKAITSNTVRGNAASIERIRRIATADIESMEGAAFFFGCLTAKTPCLQIRSISNLVEERDKSRWNLDLALKNMNQTLLELITSFPPES